MSKMLSHTILCYVVLDFIIYYIILIIWGWERFKVESTISDKRTERITNRLGTNTVKCVGGGGPEKFA